MQIKEYLNQIRGEQYTQVTIQQTTLQVLLSFTFGAFIGFIAKFSDTIPSNGLSGNIWGSISDITTRLGIWVLLATIIAAWSKNPRIGSLKVFAFFTGMLLIYYLYSLSLFGFFPTYHFIRWGLIALASPIAAYIVWFGRGKGWIAALCAAIPIGLLASEGYPFFYIFKLTLAFDMSSAILLLLILPMNKSQRFRVFPLAMLILLLLLNSNFLSYLFGGL